MLIGSAPLGALANGESPRATIITALGRYWRAMLRPWRPWR